MFEYKDDRIFIFSMEEYEKYKELIPQIKCWWWLRSPGYYSTYILSVDPDGSIDRVGNYILNDTDAVRPALWFSFTSFEPGDKFIYCGVTWVVLDKNLAITEVPIVFHNFDNHNNNYKESEVRQFLLEWYMHRKNFCEILKG